MAFDRNWLLHALRIVLHAGVLTALTLHSTQIGNALHPFTRALANEWIHLLFYVDTVKRVPVWHAPSSSAARQAARSTRSSTTADATTVSAFDEDDDDFTLVPVTLPLFLLEIEEEVAANVEDEFFNGGFAARASSYPVGMLFTINETKQHLHGAVRNYFRLADVALDAFVLAGDGDDPTIPFPELLVRSENGSETIDTSYVLTGQNEHEWPEPLQRDDASAAATRAFFDRLDAMRLQFIVGTKRRNSDYNNKQTHDVLEWRVVLTYNLQSQGHLEVAMHYVLQPRALTFDSKRTRTDLPSVFFTASTVFSGVVLLLLGAYQCAEFAVKWHETRASLASSTHVSPPVASTVSTTVVHSAKIHDVWCWSTLLLNVATATCVVVAWHEPFALALRDDLCLAFALCSALQWLSVVRYLRASARFHILGLTLQRGLPRVAQFLAGVLPVFVGYVLFGTVMFGAHVPRFQSPGATATTLFAVANGDEIHDTFVDVAYTPYVGAAYVYSYLLLFSYVVLMVCIGIIEDAFFAAVFPASWPSLDKTERDAAAAAATAAKQRSNEEAGMEEDAGRYEQGECNAEDAPLLARA